MPTSGTLAEISVFVIGAFQFLVSETSKSLGNNHTLEILGRGEDFSMGVHVRTMDWVVLL